MRIHRLWLETLLLTSAMLVVSVASVLIFKAMHNDTDTHLTATLTAGLFLFFALGLLYVSVGSGSGHKKSRDRQGGQAEG